MGNGTFYSQGLYITGSQPVFLATADFNGDGKIDIVTTNKNANSISVFFNRGSALFNNQTAYTTNIQPYAVTVGDVNSDGYADIIVGNQNSADVSVFLSYCA